jgi:hypothetical protein
LAAPETSGAAGTAEASTGETSSGKQGTSFVVFLALYRVGQDVVGLRDILETGFGCGVSGIFIRMVLASEGSVLLLELVGTGIFGHTQSCVKVLLEPVLVHCPSLKPLLLKC